MIHGRGDTVDSQIVDSNSPAAEPPAPTKTGYDFGGWYREAACLNRWDFENDMVVSDLTLYAGWKVAIGNGGTDGQAALDAGTTDLQLDDSTSLDLQAGIQTASGDQIVIGGETEDLSDYSGGDLENIDLTSPLNIGGKNIQVEQAVRLESGVEGEPVTITNPANTDISVSIPDGTAIMADGNWDGTLIPPKAVPEAGTAPAGFSIGDTIIEVGSPGGILLFDKPVILELKGVTGPVGYKPAGSDTWVRITLEAAGDYNNPLAPDFPGEAYISNGTDTKIITWHFTGFAALSAVIPAGIA